MVNESDFTTVQFYDFEVCTLAVLVPINVATLLQMTIHACRTKQFAFYFRWWVCVFVMFTAYMIQLVWCLHLYPQWYNNKNLLVSGQFYRQEEYIWQYRVIPVMLFAWVMYDVISNVREPKQPKWINRARWFFVFIVIITEVIAMQLGNYYAGRMVFYSIVPGH